MLAQNMIPGMKVFVKNVTGSDGRSVSSERNNEMYIVRRMVRVDERHANSMSMCVVHERINNMEGNYTRADLIDLLELPKSFSKRNEKYIKR